MDKEKIYLAQNFLAVIDHSLESEYSSLNNMNFGDQIAFVSITICKDILMVYLSWHKLDRLVHLYHSEVVGAGEGVVFTITRVLLSERKSSFIIIVTIKPCTIFPQLRLLISFPTCALFPVLFSPGDGVARWPWVPARCPCPDPWCRRWSWSAWTRAGPWSPQIWNHVTFVDFFGLFSRDMSDNESCFR